MSKEKEVSAMKPMLRLLTPFVFLFGLTGTALAQQDQSPQPAQAPAPAQPDAPPGPPPAEPPPPPASQPPQQLVAPPADAQPVAQVSYVAPDAPPPPEPQRVYAYPSGQWVYTDGDGWVWVPAGAGTMVVEGAPYAYLYTPAYGWTWYVSPWGPGRYHFGGWVRHAWHPTGWHGAWVATPRVFVRLGGNPHYRWH
jgi:hypothetical protein